MTGRPTIYSQELADTICERLADGESLRTICLSDAMPARSAIFRWLNENKSFQDQYARAREEQAESLADELAYIADTEEDVQRARLKIDVRKWAASKLKPKKYGDKLDVEHNGSLTVEIVRFGEDTPAE